VLDELREGAAVVLGDSLAKHLIGKLHSSRLPSSFHSRSPARSKAEGSPDTGGGRQCRRSHSSWRASGDAWCCR
jgi:hypothetical protein